MKHVKSVSRSRTPEYQHNHWRVRDTFGNAKTYQCLWCFDTARDWAQLHGTDPTNPENYIPLCSRDHMDYDRYSSNWHENQRKAASIYHKDRWKDPAYRAKMRAAVIASNKRRAKR